MAILQKTLNENVNTAAVLAYAANLDTQADHVAGDDWPDDPAPENASLITRLRVAAGEVRAAVESAHQAEIRASDAAYARLYGRPNSARSRPRCPERSSY